MLKKMPRGKITLKALKKEFKSFLVREIKHHHNILPTKLFDELCRSMAVTTATQRSLAPAGPYPTPNPCDDSVCFPDSFTFSSDPENFPDTMR